MRLSKPMISVRLMNEISNDYKVYINNNYLSININNNEVNNVSFNLDLKYIEKEYFDGIEVFNMNDIINESMFLVKGRCNNNIEFNFEDNYVNVDIVSEINKAYNQFEYDFVKKIEHVRNEMYYRC